MSDRLQLTEADRTTLSQEFCKALQDQLRGRGREYLRQRLDAAACEWARAGGCDLAEALKPVLEPEESTLHWPAQRSLAYATRRMLRLEHRNGIRYIGGDVSGVFPPDRPVIDWLERLGLVVEHDPANARRLDGWIPTDVGWDVLRLIGERG